MALAGAVLKGRNGFQVRRFEQTFARLIFPHVVVTDLYRESANAAALLPNRGKKLIGHPSQNSLNVFFVCEVRCESFLMAKRFLRLAEMDQRPLVNAVGKLMNCCSLISEQKFKHGHWRK